MTYTPEGLTAQAVDAEKMGSLAWARQLRAHAAALETIRERDAEIARLRGHCEAMASELEFTYAGVLSPDCVNDYRRDEDSNGSDLAEPSGGKEAGPEEDRIEAAYWRFDARHKGYGQWEKAPMSKRDAFKAEMRNALGAEKTRAEMRLVASGYRRDEARDE